MTSTKGINLRRRALLAALAVAVSITAVPLTAGDAAAVPDFFQSSEFKEGANLGVRIGNYDGYRDGSRGLSKVSYDDVVETNDFRYRIGYKKGYKRGYDRAYLRGVTDYKNRVSQRRND